MEEINDLFDKKWMQDTHEKIRGSAVFLSIFTNNYMDDPAALLQLAYAIMLNKPLYFIVPHGTVIPEKIKKIADKLDFFNPDDKQEMQNKVSTMLKEQMT